jgi:hypothetical protein
MVAAWDHM